MRETGARMVLVTLIALATAATALIFAASATAAIGDLSFDSCYSNDGSGGDCADLQGPTILAPSGIVMSPDGDSLYVAAQNSDSVTHFTVDAAGKPTFGGCVSQSGSSGACADVFGSAFSVPSELAISADGDSLYVLSLASDSVSHFIVAPAGQLTYAGCISDDGSGGACADVPGSAFDGIEEMAISPDGDSLYVSSGFSDTVSHLFAAPQGQLTYGGCVSQDGSGGFCANVPGSAFDAPGVLAVSPNGSSVYVASANSDSVSHFSAAPAGQITFGDCVSNDGSAGDCSDVPGAAFNFPDALAMSPDGQSLYVASFLSSSVSRLSVGPTGALAFGDCVSGDGSAGTCTDLPDLPFIGPGELEMSPDGTSLYVRSVQQESITHLRVAPAGQLSFGNCLANEGLGGCSNIPGAAFSFPTGLAASPDGRSVYAVASLGSDSVTRFVREPAPPADTTPPGLTLRVGKKPQAGKPVKVTVTCTEACAVDLTGTAKPKGSKRGSLKPANTNLGAGASATLELKPKGKLKKALKSSGKGKATIVATATDASGNSGDAAAKVKLK